MQASASRVFLSFIDFISSARSLIWRTHFSEGWNFQNFPSKLVVKKNWLTYFSCELNFDSQKVGICPSFPTTDLHRPAGPVRLNISCRRASESRRVGDAEWEEATAGRRARKVRKTRSTLGWIPNCCYTVVLLFCIFFCIFLLGLSLLYHKKTYKFWSTLILFSDSLFFGSWCDVFPGFFGVYSQPGEFRQGGTSQSRWRLHYAEWDSRCQWNAAKQIYVLTKMLRIKKKALADSKISWISWNEEITWIQHTWVTILSSFRDKGTTPGEPNPFGWFLMASGAVSGQVLLASGGERRGKMDQLVFWRWRIWYVPTIDGRNPANHLGCIKPYK